MQRHVRELASLADMLIISPGGEGEGGGGRGGTLSKETIVPPSHPPLELFLYSSLRYLKLNVDFKQSPGCLPLIIHKTYYFFLIWLIFSRFIWSRIQSSYKTSKDY